MRSRVVHDEGHANGRLTTKRAAGSAIAGLRPPLPPPEISTAPADANLAYRRRPSGYYRSYVALRSALRLGLGDWNGVKQR